MRNKRNQEGGNVRYNERSRFIYILSMQLMSKNLFPFPLVTATLINDTGRIVWCTSPF